MQVCAVAEAQVITGSCLKPFFLRKEGFLTYSNYIFVKTGGITGDGRINSLFTLPVTSCDKKRGAKRSS
jgi:hypothetical protein